MTEPVWNPVNPLLESGDYPGICVMAREATSAAGNPMIVWTFELESGRRLLNRYTLRKGSGAAATHETAMALGLGKRFRLSAAVGRSCVLVVGVDGQWNTIERCK